MKIAQRSKKGTNILCMLADTAERYMSSILFDNIEEEMNDDELSIYDSVYLFRILPLLGSQQLAY